MSRRVHAPAAARVSVVIPYFNHGAVVADALESIRVQSRPVDQIVVVDDGSTDAFSLSVLSRLEGTDVLVSRQDNQGPGSARNLGVAHCDGDAVLFLDSDDVVSEHHVEKALATLADAPEEVGFVYPDMQFMGNEHHLVVMPPYNLYLLLYRNFCCMGGLIDRSVFEAGYQFRADRWAGHEDWDFFVNLGLNGIFGQSFHGTPLGYRRWGYSRSDGVNENQFYGPDMRNLHPDVHESGRLIEIKREWAPALSVIVPPSGGHTVASQTCDDFEIVTHGGGRAPRVRGRWVLMLGQGAGDALNDGTFIERVVRLASDHAPPVPIALHSPTTPTVGWRRVKGEEAGALMGVVAAGSIYLHWSNLTREGAADLADLNAYFESSDGITERWAYGRSPTSRPVGGITDDDVVVPLSSFRSSRTPPETPVEQLEMSGSEVERAFRHHEAPPLFMPAGGVHRLPNAPGSLDDGLSALTERAWLDWTPSRSRQLTLVVDADGQATLETADHLTPARLNATGRQPASVPIGWIWTQPFPGTACLSSHFDLPTHSVTYRVSDEEATGEGDAVLGYAPTEFLPGRIDLTRAIGEGVNAVRGPQRVQFPPFHHGVPGVFVESVGGPVGDAGDSVGRVPAPWRWPLFEIAHRSGEFRYTRDPDDCVGGGDEVRPFATAVAEIAPIEPGAEPSELYEVLLAGGPAVAYVSGSERATSPEQLVPVRALGSLRKVDASQVPLVRLVPAPEVPATLSTPGHRLATDWQALVDDGHVTEGVIGYAWKPDPDRAPLYRWRNPSKDAWEISLGEDPGRSTPALTFEGTLGAAWWAGTTSAGRVDLWELERDTCLAFATERDDLLRQGFVERRVIARLLRRQRPGSLPLLAMYSPDGRRCLLTTSAGEGESLGLVRPSLLGFVDGAMPTAAAVDAAVPAVAVRVDETDGLGGELHGYLFRAEVSGGAAVWSSRGAGSPPRIAVGERPDDHATLLGFALGAMVPHSHPVYRVAGDEGQPDIVTTELPRQGLVRDVVCFLPEATSMKPPGGPEREQGVLSGVRRRRWKR